MMNRYDIYGEIPTFLEDYINTPPMQHLAGVSNACGADFFNFFPTGEYADVLSHSIGCALIVWQHTGDKVQTLAGLFHDIASPAFKHIVDGLNGDFEKEESIEDTTEEILVGSPEINELLKRDHIKISEVSDYHIYPIADNDSPRLAADRLEYTLSDLISGMYGNPLPKETATKIYQDIKVLKNEDDIVELGFTNLEIAEEYIDLCAKYLWKSYFSPENKIVSGILIDAFRAMFKADELSYEELFKISEEDVIERIYHSKVPGLTKFFKDCQAKEKVFSGEKLPEGKTFRTLSEDPDYFDKIKPGDILMNSFVGKNRFIDPLVSTKNGAERVSNLSKKSAELISRQKHFSQAKYDWIIM